MNVVMIPLDRIKPYPENPRENDLAVGAVAKSISEYGFNSPIVVDKNYVIIAGHTRHRAAQLLGLSEAPVVVLDIPEEKAKQYRIADNKTAEFSEWNMNDLVAELRELGDMTKFFPMLDVAALLRDTAGVSNFATPNQEEIEETQARIEQNFSSKSDDNQDSYSRVVCPSCKGEFFVDKNEADRESQRGGD